jgi:hypothetical protein
MTTYMQQRDEQQNAKKPFKPRKPLQGTINQ